MTFKSLAPSIALVLFVSKSLVESLKNNALLLEIRSRLQRYSVLIASTCELNAIDNTIRVNVRTSGRDV